MRVGHLAGLHMYTLAPIVGILWIAARTTKTKKNHINAGWLRCTGTELLLQPHMHGRTYGDLQMAQLVHIGLPLQASRDCLLQGLDAQAQFAGRDQ